MIKRPLLLIAGVIVVIGLVSDSPTKMILEAVGVLIFLVLGIALAISGMGCVGPTILTPIGIVCIEIAAVLALDLFGYFSFITSLNPESLNNICQVTIRDVNNTIVSNYTTACP